MPKVINTVTRSLSYKMTEAERVSAGIDLANLLDDIRAEEDRQEDIKTQLKAKLTELHTKLKRLTIMVRRGERIEEVKINYELSDSGEVVTEVRTDKLRSDPAAIVNIRLPSPSELQLGLEVEPVFDKAQPPPTVSWPPVFDSLVTSFSIKVGQDDEPYTMMLGGHSVTCLLLKEGLTELLKRNNLTIADVRAGRESEGKKQMLAIMGGEND